jgi:hypothetical protein
LAGDNRGGAFSIEDEANDTMLGENMPVGETLLPWRWEYPDKRVSRGEERVVD